MVPLVLCLVDLIHPVVLWVLRCLVVLLGRVLEDRWVLVVQCLVDPTALEVPVVLYPVVPVGLVVL